MSEKMELQPDQQPGNLKEKVDIAKPLEVLKSTSEKLAKFGGVDLIESSVEGTKNVNPERKARRNIFLNEMQKKAEREPLQNVLSIWADVLETGN